MKPPLPTPKRALARPGERGDPSPRRHEGTQGPGHFTVRPLGAHYRAHPLRFWRFRGKPQQEIQEMQEIQEAPVNGRERCAERQSRATLFRRYRRFRRSPASGRRTKPLCLQVGTSQTCLRRAGGVSPCRGVGQRPTKPAKLPSFQTSKLPILRPAGDSRPLIGSNRRNRR